MIYKYIYIRGKIQRLSRYGQGKNKTAISHQNLNLLQNCGKFVGIEVLNAAQRPYTFYPRFLHWAEKAYLRVLVRDHRKVVNYVLFPEIAELCSICWVDFTRFDQDKACEVPPCKYADFLFQPSDILKGKNFYLLFRRFVAYRFHQPWVAKREEAMIT